LVGTLQHISYAAEKLKVDMFEKRHRIRRLQHPGLPGINESDMLLMPDPTTAFIDRRSKFRPSRSCATSRPVTGKATRKTLAASPSLPRNT